MTCFHATRHIHPIPTPTGSPRRRRPMTGVLVLVIGGVGLLGAACSGDDDTSTTDETSLTTAAPAEDAPADEEPSTDEGSDGPIECEAAISIADVARITQLPITTCFSDGNFRTDDGLGLNVVVERHSSEDEAQEEAALSGTGDRFSGTGWDGIERLGGAGAAAGNLSMRITLADLGDNGFQDRTDEEMQAMYAAIFDAVVANVG